MPAKTRVYHGTQSAFEPSEIQSPKGPRIIEYMTNKQLKLLYVEGRRTFDDLEELFGFNMQDVESMAENVCRIGYDGWYIENNYIEDDTMICDSSNLRFIKIHSDF